MPEVLVQIQPEPYSVWCSVTETRLYLPKEQSHITGLVGSTPTITLQPIQGRTMELPINYPASHWAVRKAARLQYAEEQNGKCWHCQTLLINPPSKTVRKQSVNELLFPRGFFKNPTHLHYNHKSGMTIGTVHAKCNAVLWQYHGE